MMDIDFSLNEYTRVLKLARTPSWEEFVQVAKIAGAGVVFIGVLGFLIYTVMSPLPPTA